MTMKSKFLICLALVAMLINCKKNTTETAMPEDAKDSVAMENDTLAVLPHEPMVPGKSLGITSIGDNTEAAVKGLGKPFMGDAAMGKSVATFKIDNNGADAMLTVASSRTMSEDNDVIQVQMLRTTASKFKTSNKLGVGSTLQEIEKFYALEKVGKFIEDKKNFTLYDTNAGIAFEIDNEKMCTGVVIHPVEKATNAMYLPMYENFTDIEGVK